MQTVELLLRFFTFYDEYASYNGRLSLFLNIYMESKRYADNLWMQQKEKLFIDTINLVNKSIDPSIKTRTSKTIIEAIMFGIANNLKHLKLIDKKKIREYCKTLRGNKEFSEEQIREGILKKEKVLRRLKIAKKIFAGKV